MIISSVILFSQNENYTVLTKSGDVVLLNDALEEIADINIGDKLYSDDNFLLKKNGYIVIINSELQSLELTEEGSYNLSIIDTLFSVKKTSISENITKFIFEEMSTKKEQYNEMKTLGSVVRTSHNVIELSTPNYGVLKDTNYTFSWYPSQISNDYIFRIFNENSSTLFMKGLTDTALTLNLSDFNLQYGKKYFWTISLSNSTELQTDSAEIILLSPIEIATLEKEIEMIENDFNNEQSPLKNYTVAKYLISKDLYESAISYMKICIDLVPNSNLYWSSYINLLMESGLSREAIIAWNKSPFSK